MPAKTDIWMPMYIGDIVADTMHLTPAEFGAYHLIIYHQWRNGPIPPRSLRSITRMSPEEWSESEATLKAFLRLDADGNYYQRRCQVEKEKSDKLSETSRRNGALGGRPKTQKEPGGKPRNNPAGNPEHNLHGTQKQTPSQSHSHSSLQSKTKEGSPFDAPMVMTAVLNELCLAGQPLALALSDIASRKIKKGEDGLELVHKLCEAWREYEKAKPHLAFTPGPAKFFGDGMWEQDRAGWPWKEGKRPPPAKPSHDILEEIRQRNAKAEAEMEAERVRACRENNPGSDAD